jgi:hypothetical protein
LDFFRATAFANVPLGPPAVAMQCLNSSSIYEIAIFTRRTERSCLPTLETQQSPTIRRAIASGPQLTSSYHHAIVRANLVDKKFSFSSCLPSVISLGCSQITLIKLCAIEGFSP